MADEPEGNDLAELKELYFRRFPKGREREILPGMVYIRCRPTWIRFSDFNQTPSRIVEFDAKILKKMNTFDENSD